MSEAEDVAEAAAVVLSAATNASGEEVADKPKTPGAEVITEEPGRLVAATALLSPEADPSEAWATEEERTFSQKHMWIEVNHDENSCCV